MIFPIVWLAFGYVLLITLLTDSTFNELDLLNSMVEKAVVVLFWPAFVLVMILWRFCRADSDPGTPRI